MGTTGENESNSETLPEIFQKPLFAGPHFPCTKFDMTGGMLCKCLIAFFKAYARPDPQ